MCDKFQGQKSHIKKAIQNLPTCVAMRNLFTMPTLTPSQGLIFYLFTMTYFSQDHLYANNMCAKFEGQKIYTTKDIHNLPTCVVVGNNGENHFTATHVGRFLIFFLVNLLAFKFGTHVINLRGDLVKNKS
jgi:hypothetical protein